MSEQHYSNDNDADYFGFRYSAHIVNTAAQLVEKYAPYDARSFGSFGWWVHTNAVAYALGDDVFKTGKDRIERTAKYLKMSPVTLYNDPIFIN